MPWRHETRNWTPIVTITCEMDVHIGHRRPRARHIIRFDEDQMAKKKQKSLIVCLSCLTEMVADMGHSSIKTMTIESLEES